MTQIISFVQQKGGVGKTTLLATLAGFMARDMARVLIVDTDPQASATHWAKHDTSNVQYYHTTDEDILDTTLDTATGKFDIILIDTIGSDSSLVAFVIAQSDVVILPFDTTVTDINCAVSTVKLVARIAKTSNKDIQVAFIANRYDKRSRIGRKNMQALEIMHPLYADTGQRFKVLFGCPSRPGFKEMFTTGGLPTGSAYTEANQFLASLQIHDLIQYYTAKETHNG